MSANHSNATQTRTYEYRPTVIEDKLLFSRLATQLAFVKKDPLGFLKQTARDLLSTRHAILALAVVAAAVMFALLPATTTPTSAQDNAIDAGPIEDMVFLDPKTNQAISVSNRAQAEAQARHRNAHRVVAAEVTTVQYPSKPANFRPHQ